MGYGNIPFYPDIPISSYYAYSIFVCCCLFFLVLYLVSPTNAEYVKIIRAVGVGFVMMGVVGYAVKLLHIPIRYLIV